MDQIHEYYIVPKEKYQRVFNTESFSDKISKLSVRIQRKFNKLFEALQEKGSVGNSKEEGSAHFESILYAITGRHRPKGWNTFVKSLVNIPNSLLCVTVQREIKKLKRKNGRKVRAESMD